MSQSLNSVRMTRKYRAYLDELVAPGAVIINYSEKATGRPCDICRHVPEQRPAKEGYEFVSEEMRLMRVRLPASVKAESISAGKQNFTVTGQLIELNVCKDTTDCRARAAKLMQDDGVTPLYPDRVLAMLT